MRPSLPCVPTRRVRPTGGAPALGLFGYRDPELVRFADEIATRWQLTTLLADVASDAARDTSIFLARICTFSASASDIKALRLARPSVI